jgi:hypothetical protein
VTIRIDLFTKFVLTAIAVLLAVLAVRPGGDLPSVQAQSDYSHLYVEPGTTIVRTPDGRGQVQGKVVINLRNGEAWGFPTASSAPYPVYLSSNQPPVSKPVYLGQFDFASMKR